MPELSTNFSPEMIPKINEVLKFVLENQHSDFYRKKYEKNPEFYPIRSYADFQKIPFLIKDEILSTEIENRTFLPQEQINYYSFSSGTTKKSIPTIIPHGSYADLYDANPHKKVSYEKLGVKKILLLLPPTHGLIRNSLGRKNTSFTYILGDMHNLKLMAKIIKTLNIDAITTTPTALEFLHGELTNEKFDFSKIKFVSLGSEFCSSARYAYFKKNFPSALFEIRYGNSEQGGGKRHYRCEFLEKNYSPNVFHIDAAMGLVEIVDDFGKTLPMGEAGEIISTDLFPKAFPLLRYKLKDMGSLSVKTCPCGNSTLLKLSGRTESDNLRINGVILRTEMINSAVLSAQNFVESKHQMHVKEEIINGKPKIQLELHLVLRKPHAEKKEDAMLIEIIKEKISENLRLSGKRNLHTLVEDGVFLPLKIVFDEHLENENETKGIINHIL